MRVLHVITGLQVGGAELMLERLVSRRALVAAEPEVASLTTLGPVGERLRAAGVPVHVLGSTRGPEPRLLLRLVRLLRERRPAVVQSWMYHADLVAGLAGRLTGTPVVWGLHNGDPDPATTPARTRWVVRACALASRFLPRRIVSCSQRALEIHRGLGYDATKFVVIYNGFDTTRFAPNGAARVEVRRELGLPSEALLVGMVGRFHPQKDHRTFIEAARLLCAGHPTLRFILCGNGLDATNAQLVSWLDSAGVRGRFLLLGRREDVPRLTAAFDVAASSSSSEAFPSVLVEAMACGVPCVTTDVGDATLILGGYGEVVPPRDPARLAAAIDRTLNLPAEERSRRGADGRLHVVTRFGLDTAVRRYAALHREVASNQGTTVLNHTDGG